MKSFAAKIFPKSMLVRIALFFLISFVCIFSLLPYLSVRIQNETFNTAEKTYVAEKKSLFDGILRSKSDALSAQVSRWMTPKNLEPILSDPVDMTSWNNSMLGFANTLAWRFGTERIIIYDYEGNLFQNYLVVPEAGEFDLEDKNLKELFEVVTSDESVVPGFVNSTVGVPYSVLAIPSFDEEEELSHVHLYFSNFSKAVEEFSKFSHNNTYLMVGGDKYFESNVNKIPEGASIHTRRIPLPENSNNGKQVELVSTVNISKTISEFDQSNKNLFIQASVVSFTFLLLVILFLKVMLKPLSSISKAAQGIARGDLSIRAEEKGSEEISSLAKTINKMIDTIMERNQYIMDIYSNIKFGIFTIDEDGRIDDEYSKALEDLLDTKEIANNNILDIIFKNSNTVTQFSDDQLNSVKESIFASVGHDVFSFQLNLDNFIREFSYQSQEKEIRHLELDWQAIIDENSGEVSKILVIVRDVTDVKAMAAEFAQQTEKLEILGQIVAMSIKKFHQQMNSCRSLLSECHTSIGKIKDIQLADEKEEVVGELFRYMHTLKGNARTFNLTLIAETAHKAEEKYSLLRSDPSVNFAHEELHNDLMEINSKLELYENTFQEVLGGESDEQRVQEYEKFFQECRQLLGNIEPSQYIEDENIHRLIRNLRHFGSYSVAGIMDNLNEKVKKLALDLEKPSPQINITGDEVLFGPKIAEALENIFIHCLRNTMDHGIESPSQRQASGKPEQGSISFEVVRNAPNKELNIVIKDDGRGLNLEGLRTKLAVNQSTIVDQGESDVQIAESIFDGGISTAASVNDISGRGVGMDAIRSFLRQNNGDVNIQFTGSKTKDGFRPFQLVLSLPESSYFEN